MRFRLRLILSLILASSLLAGTARAQATRITSGATLPVSAVTGNIYIKTGASAGFYFYISGWVGPFATPIGNVTTSAVLTAGKLIQGNGTTDITINATTATVTKLTSGVPSAASAGTDYVAPGSITTSGLTMNTARLLGRTTAASGAVEEITVGSGLSLSAGSLTASACATCVTTSTTLTAHAVILGNGGVDVVKVGSLGTAAQVLTSNGAGLDPSWQAATGGSWIPLVDGAEPPAFITDGAGVLILVAYP